jgi:hypothetical protein
MCFSTKSGKLPVAIKLGGKSDWNAQCTPTLMGLDKCGYCKLVVKNCELQINKISK